MMVTVAGAGDGGVKDLVSTLLTESNPAEDRVSSYTKLIDHLREDEGGTLPHSLSKLSGQLLPRLQADVELGATNTEVSQTALQALGFCLHHAEISKSISDDLARSLLRALCTTLKVQDKTTAIRALWCIAKQNFPSTVVKEELSGVLDAILGVKDSGSFQSVSVEHESLNAIRRLLEQVPGDMAVHAHRWSKLVLLSVVHTAPKVRERAAAALEIGVPAMMPQQEAVVAGLIPELKSTLIPELTKLFKPNQEEFVLKVWGSIITLLGKSIHKGGSVINGLLGIVEQGFKSAYIDTRVASYVAWKHLINNFATNPDTISNAKRLKLLLQPLLMNSTKQESVAVVRLNSWWHLARTLGTNLPPNFEQVCGPLLQFTLGLTPGLPTPATPAGGKMLLATTPQRRGSFPASNPATPRTPGVGGGHPPSKAIQLIGAEILLHLLGKTGTAAAAKLTLAPLHEELITSPAFFIKHAETFIRATQEALCAVGSDLQEAVVLNIWSSLTGHIRQALQEGPRKDSQISDMFSQYLACTQEVVASRKLRAGVMLKLLEEVSSLPQKVLSSTSYCHGGSKDVMNGTPALVLLQLLLESPDLIQACSTEERYFTVFQSLVSCGASRPTSFLGFSQSVLQNLDKTASCVSCKESLWRVWSSVASPLLDHVRQNNEVNQGDSLEHDFSALYAALLLPAAHIFTAEKFPHASLKAALRTWTDLYRSFAMCAAMVTTAPANTCCEELSLKLLHVWKGNSLKTPQALEAAASVLQTMLDCVDFSEITSENKAIMPLSPAKFQQKKQQRTMGNLTSLVTLVSKVMEELHHISGSEITATAAALSTIGGGVISMLSLLFGHITQPAMIGSLLSKLANQIAVFYQSSTRGASTSKLYSAQFMLKLEKLWGELLTCVQTRHGGPYNTDFLATLSSLLQHTFLHSRQPIRNQTLLFWNATFATSHSLVYPEELKPVLKKVHDKTPISLPGWQMQTDVPLAAGSSQQTEESQSSALPSQDFSLPNVRSPKLMRESFLRMGAKSSPARFGRSQLRSPSRSPARSPTKSPAKSPAKMAVRRKLHVDEESNKDFVFIPPSPKKPLVLTERQKERMRERGVVPALYNDLDASQDGSQFSQLMSQSSQTAQPPADKQNSPDSTEKATVKEQKAPQNEGKQADAETTPEVMQTTDVKQQQEVVSAADHDEKTSEESMEVTTEDAGDKPQETVKKVQKTVTMYMEDLVPATTKTMYVKDVVPATPEQETKDGTSSPKSPGKEENSVDVVCGTPPPKVNRRRRSTFGHSYNSAKKRGRRKTSDSSGQSDQSISNQLEDSKESQKARQMDQSQTRGKGDDQSEGSTGPSGLWYNQPLTPGNQSYPSITASSSQSGVDQSGGRISKSPGQSGGSIGKATSPQSECSPSQTSPKMGKLPPNMPSPVIKLVRLSKKEIKKFSPNKAEKKQSVQPASGKLKKGLKPSWPLKDSAKDDTQHSNDDFSDLKPLEKSAEDKEGNAQVITPHYLLTTKSPPQEVKRRGRSRRSKVEEVDLATTSKEVSPAKSIEVIPETELQESEVGSTTGNHSIEEPKATSLEHVSKENPELCSTQDHDMDTPTSQQSNAEEEGKPAVKRRKGRQRKSLLASNPDIESSQEAGNVSFNSSIDSVSKDPEPVKRKRGRSPKVKLETSTEDAVNLSLEELKDSSLDSVFKVEACSSQDYNADTSSQQSHAGEGPKPAVQKKKRGRPRKSIPTACDADSSQDADKKTPRRIPTRSRRPSWKVADGLKESVSDYASSRSEESQTKEEPASLDKEEVEAVDKKQDVDSEDDLPLSQVAKQTKQLTGGDNKSSKDDEAKSAKEASGGNSVVEEMVNSESLFSGYGEAGCAASGQSAVLSADTQDQSIEDTQQQNANVFTSNDDEEPEIIANSQCDPSGDMFTSHKILQVESADKQLVEKVSTNEEVESIDIQDQDNKCTNEEPGASDVQVIPVNDTKQTVENVEERDSNREYKILRLKGASPVALRLRSKMTKKAPEQVAVADSKEVPDENVTSTKETDVEKDQGEELAIPGDSETPEEPSSSRGTKKVGRKPKTSQDAGGQTPQNENKRRLSTKARRSITRKHKSLETEDLKEKVSESDPTAPKEDLPEEAANVSTLDTSADDLPKVEDVLKDSPKTSTPRKRLKKSAAAGKVVGRRHSTGAVLVYSRKETPRSAKAKSVGKVSSHLKHARFSPPQKSDFHSSRGLLSLRMAQRKHELHKSSVSTKLEYLMTASQGSPTRTTSVPTNPSSPTSSNQGYAAAVANQSSPTISDSSSTSDSPPGFAPYLKMYSPSASPSARGILKKRLRKRGAQKVNSPSPPNKVRRVSFADPIEMSSDDQSEPRRSPKPVSRCLELPRPQIPPSPLVTTSPTGAAITSLEQNKFITTPSKKKSTEEAQEEVEADAVFATPSGRAKRVAKDGLPASPDLTPSQGSALQQSQSQALSSLTTQSQDTDTQDSQLGDTEPVYPDLAGCKTPVDQILPQLTSMVWARGLNQLVRARNIHTIGDISTLTPLEVQSLPIRPPKVTTLKKALEMFHNQQETKRLKQTSGSKMEATDSLAAASHESKTEGTADLEPAKETDQVTDQPEFTKEKDQETAVPETPEKMDGGLPPPEPMEKDDGLAQSEPTEEDLGSTKLETAEGRDSGSTAVEPTENCESSKPEPTEKDNILPQPESKEESQLEPKEKDHGSTQPDSTEKYHGSTKPMEGHGSTQPEPSDIHHGSPPPEPTENTDHGSIQPDSTEDHESKDPTEERAQLSPVVDLTKDSNNEGSPLLQPTPETDPVPAVVDLTDDMDQPTSVQPIMTHVSPSAQPSETDQAPTTVQPTEAREEGVQQLDFDGVAAINDFVDDTSVPSSVESSPIRGALPYFPIFSSGPAGMNTEGLDVESILENVNVASAATSLEVDGLSESTDMFSTAAEVGSPVVEMLRELVSMDADNVAQETNAMATDAAAGTQPFEVTLQELSSREMSVVETLSAVNERIMRGELSGLPSSQISAVHQMLNRMMMMAVSELQTRCVSPRQQNRKQ